jgi:hypothetical protein
MVNTNRRNPIAGEPTRQSGRAAGKRPTSSSPLLQHTRWFDLGKRKDPPESFPLPLESTVQQCTVSKTQRKDLPKDLRKDSPKDSPSFQLTINGNKQILKERKQCLLLQPPPCPCEARIVTPSARIYPRICARIHLRIHPGCNLLSRRVDRFLRRGNSVFSSSLLPGKQRVMITALRANHPFSLLLSPKLTILRL